MPKKSNAQAALAAAVKSTSPGLSNTTQMVLKRADTFKAWLDDHDKEETPS